jgi:hypothetical protein
LGTPVGQLHRGRGAGRKQQGSSAAAVAVGYPARPVNLQHAGAQAHRAHLGVERNHHDFRQRRIILPGSVDLALGWQIPCFLVVHDQAAAAVDSQIKHSVGSAQRLAKLGVFENGEGDAGKRMAIALADLTAQDGHTKGLEGPGATPV